MSPKRLSSSTTVNSNLTYPIFIHKLIVVSLLQLHVNAFLQIYIRLHLLVVSVLGRPNFTPITVALSFSML